jgi:hypothetical protein
MEYALRLESPEGLPADPLEWCSAPWRELLPPGRLAALYFGSEFCPERLPGLSTAEAFCDLARRRTLLPVLLTPVVTAEGLLRVDELLRGLSARGFQPAVVANDWGVLDLLRREHPALHRRAGRLFNRALRDPRGARAAVAAPRREPFASARLRRLLAQLGAEALETDPDLQGGYLGDGEEGLQRALHLPYAFASSGRNCLVKSSRGAPEESFIRLEAPCGSACAGEPLPVERDDSGVPLWRAGNTVFWEVPVALAAETLRQADRVVLHRRAAP